MKLRILLYTFLGIIAISCSTNNNFDENPEELEIASFRVIGVDDNSSFLFSFDGDSETENIQNLTETIGVSTNFITFRQLGDLLSFYSFFQGAFSLTQLDIASGTTNSFDNFFANGPGRSVVWGTNDAANVYFGFFTPGNPRNIAIQALDLQSLTSTDIFIDFDVETLYQPLLHEEKIYISYRDGQGDFKLTFYNTLTRTVGPILNFNDTPISILIDEFGDVAVVKNGTSATVERYDANTLTLVDNTPLNFNSAFNPGPIAGTVISNDKLYYARAFAQPAEFPAGPAIFDLIMQENIAIDLFNITDQIETELNTNITITNQVYSVAQDAFLISYGVLGDTIQGGVMQVSNDGTLVANTMFPFQPTDILED